MTKGVPQIGFVTKMITTMVFVTVEPNTKLEYKYDKMTYNSHEISWVTRRVN